jgi:hypothetical protein
VDSKWSHKVVGTSTGHLSLVLSHSSINNTTSPDPDSGNECDTSYNLNSHCISLTDVRLAHCHTHLYLRTLLIRVLVRCRCPNTNRLCTGVLRSTPYNYRISLVLMPRNMRPQLLMIFSPTSSFHSHPEHTPSHCPTSQSSPSSWPLCQSPLTQLPPTSAVHRVFL